jgi:hypothetical protein
MARYSRVTASSISGVNAELAKIETAISEMLDRDGTAPNQMEGDLDLNSNDILNAGAINGQTLTVDGTLSVGGSEITGAGDTDATADYNWTGQHTYTTTPTVNGNDVVTEATVNSTPITINTQTGTTYVSVLAAAGAVILMDNAAANTFTVPANASVAYPVGTIISVCQYGAGATSINQEGGVTVNTEVGYQIISQYGFATLLKIATDEWLLSGSLQASA